EMAVQLLNPFPPDFKVTNFRHKEGAEYAAAVILLGTDRPVNATLDDELRVLQDYRIDRRIQFSCTPRPWDGTVELRFEGERQKSWKIYLPVSYYLRESMDFLRDNGGNYAAALDRLKYSIKHEAATKADFENQLISELSKAQ